MKNKVEKTIVLTFIFSSLFVAAHADQSPSSRAEFKAYFKVGEGHAIIQQAVQAGLSEDEIKYAIVRFFHTTDGKKLIAGMVAKSGFKAGRRPGFLDKKLAKLIVLSGLGSCVFCLLEDGWIKKGLFVLIVLKILSML